MNSLKEIALDSADPVEPQTLQLTDRLSVRIYGDCRPCCLETAALQKGLVLTLDGKELIEEGVGFGVPVVKYEDKTFFSRNASISVQDTGADCKVTKIFSLDTVSVKKLGSATYIDDGVYSFARRTFERLYLKNERITPLFNKVMELRDLAKIKTEFTTVKPRGTVTVTYHCQPSEINIRADFSKVTLKKCTEILILNEQGSSVFEKYVDSDGNALIGSKIGAWQRVTARQASLQSSRGQLWFTLNNGGVTLFRGWERTRKRFSWAGLSYSMCPNNGVFNYTIGVSFKAK